VRRSHRPTSRYAAWGQVFRVRAATPSIQRAFPGGKTLDDCQATGTVLTGDQPGRAVENCYSTSMRTMDCFSIFMLSDNRQA
jgi:hypothetical protein